MYIIIIQVDKWTKKVDKSVEMGLYTIFQQYLSTNSG